MVTFSGDLLTAISRSDNEPNSPIFRMLWQPFLKSLAGIPCVHCQHHDVPVGIALRDLLHVRQGLLARTAPGRPEVQHDDLAMEIGQADRSSCAVLHLKVRSDRSHRQRLPARGNGCLAAAGIVDDGICRDLRTKRGRRGRPEVRLNQHILIPKKQFALRVHFKNGLRGDPHASICPDRLAETPAPDELPVSSTLDPCCHHSMSDIQFRNDRGPIRSLPGQMPASSGALHACLAEKRKPATERKTGAGSQPHHAIFRDLLPGGAGRKRKAPRFLADLCSRAFIGQLLPGAGLTAAT